MLDHVFNGHGGAHGQSSHCWAQGGSPLTAQNSRNANENHGQPDTFLLKKKRFPEVRQSSTIWLGNLAAVLTFDPVASRHGMVQGLLVRLPYLQLLNMIRIRGFSYRLLIDSSNHFVPPVWVHCKPFGAIVSLLARWMTRPFKLPFEYLLPCRQPTCVNFNSFVSFAGQWEGQMGCKQSSES